MAVQKVFWEDPYLTELKVKITSSEKNRVTLDRTIIYAFSGGQQSDSGTIGEWEILQRKIKGY